MDDNSKKLRDTAVDELYKLHTGSDTVGRGSILHQRIELIVDAIVGAATLGTLHHVVQATKAGTRRT